MKPVHKISKRVIRSWGVYGLAKYKTTICNPDIGIPIAHTMRLNDVWAKVTCKHCLSKRKPQ